MAAATSCAFAEATAGPAVRGTSYPRSLISAAAPSAEASRTNASA